MKDGKVEKTYASRKISVESLKKFVFENMHGHVYSTNYHKNLHKGHPKDLHHDLHNHIKSQHNHHLPSHTSSYETNSHDNVKSQHHMVYHHQSIKKPKSHKHSASSEHHILAKKPQYHHSDEHHHEDSHDIHNHPQNDQQHIHQISKVHYKSKINQHKHVAENEKKPAKWNNHHETHERHQIVAPDFMHPNDHHKQKAEKHTQFKVMEMNLHNFKSSLDPHGITFVIFYGRKTKHPATNKRIQLIKHVAKKYLKTDHSMGEVNCELQENLRLCQREKFVVDPMVNIYKRGSLLRHNYQFVHMKTGQVWTLKSIKSLIY